MAREGAEAIIKRDVPDRKSMFWLLLVLCLPQIRMRSDVEQPLDATCPTDSASALACVCACACVLACA